MDKKIGNLLADAGIVVQIDSYGNPHLEPSILKLQSLKVHLVKRGRYIADPRFVPPELQDKNIFWVDEPPVITAITDSGEEIPVICSDLEKQFELQYETVQPDSERG